MACTSIQCCYEIGVPVQILRDKVTGVVDPKCVTMGPQPILSQEHEARTVSHVKYTSSVSHVKYTSSIERAKNL